MSHTNVERVLGRLVTDEAFRRRFVEQPAATLEELVAAGVDLNPCERHALSGLDPRLLERFAEGLDRRLQKSDLRSG